MDKTRAVSRRQAITSSVIAATAVGLAATEKAVAAESATTTVGVASMTLDELVELRNQVQAEIVARVNADNAEIYAGIYAIGKDIAAGTYTYTCTEDESGDTFFVVQSQDIAASVMTNGTWGIDEGILVQQFVEPKETCFISLEEGNYLVVRTKGILTPTDVPNKPEQ